MTRRHQDEVGHFLETHQADIVALIELAQQEAGGHYAAMTAAQRHAQAESDYREMSRDLLRGGPDPQIIRHTVQEANSPTIPADIVRMSTTMEQRFRAYLEGHRTTDPVAADELLRRSGMLFARFRLNVTTGSIENLVERFNTTDPSRGDGAEPKV